MLLGIGLMSPGSALAEPTEDTQPPKLLSLSIEPNEVNVSASSQTVVVSAHITDDLSGVQNADVTFHAPNLSGSQAIAVAFERIEGSDTDGIYRAKVTIPRFAEAGAWTIIALNLIDNAKNFSQLNAEKLTAGGFPHSVKVNSEETVEDTEAPKIDELGIEPEFIDTSAAERTVFAFAHITDDVSGLKEVRVSLVSPSGEHSVQGSATEPLEGSATNGSFKIPVDFPQFSEGGTWTISSIFLADHAGHERKLSAGQIEEMGLQRKVFVKAGGDTEAPQIQGLSIEPAEIYTHSSGQTVTINAHITDDLSGFASGSIVFTSPSGEQTTEGFEFKRVSGDAQNGGYEIQVPFKQGSESGVWLITDIRLADAAGNKRVLGPEEMEERGLARKVRVESKEEFEDVQAPLLGGLQIEPASIDTNSSIQNVTLFAYVSDNFSGFKSGSFTFESPSGNQIASASEFKRVAGNANGGTYELSVPFEQSCETGVWQLSQVRLTDSDGNERVLKTGDLEEAGLPHTVVVEGEEEPKDSEAPQLHGISIEPTEIDTSSEKQPVFVTAKITDNESGFKSGEVMFLSPSGKEQLEGVEFKLISGGETEGLYRTVVIFPQGAEPGVWNVAKVRLRDHAGNERVIPGPEFEGQTAVVVQAEEPKDTEPPQLHSLAIEPTEIDTSAAKQPVFVTAKITDNLSGFKEGFIAFVSPSGEQSALGGEFKLLSGNENEGLYRVVVTFPQGSEGGEWNISAITLIDQAGNKVGIPRKEIEEAGMPHTVLVSGAAPTITAVEPSSGPETGGTEVLISGSGLSGAKEVRFGATAATEFAVKSANLVRAVSPPGTGVVDVTVATSSGTSETTPADRFTYSPQVTLSSTPNPSVHGQKVTFTAKVIPAGGSPAPLGTVAFAEGSTTLGVVNLSKGTATFNTTALGAGKHPIHALYSGDAHYGAGESPTITQNVEKASTELTLASSLNPAPYGSNATLKASVYAVSPGAGTPAGTVTFREGETVIDTVQLSGHVANLSLKTMPPGEHVISASYSGDPNNQPSSGEPVAQTIVNATTETSLTSSLNPAPFGSSATLKATVDSVAPSVLTPTGTVTFREGETVLAIVPLSAGGVAKYPLKTVAPGSYEITATYNGGEGFEGSKSALTQTIVKASTELTLTSSKNPAPKGSSGNLKATVKAIAPGGGTPTGTVTFREGETVLATVPLSTNSATYPLKSLAVGTHNVTATYNGSADYLESEGAISQVITP